MALLMPCWLFFTLSRVAQQLLDVSQLKFPALIYTNLIFPGSSSKHSHIHSQDLGLPARNPLANTSPKERLERLFMFLETQFGAEALTPIETPRSSSLARDANGSPKRKALKSTNSDSDSEDMSESDTDVDE